MTHSKMKRKTRRFTIQQIMYEGELWLKKDAVRAKLELVERVMSEQGKTVLKLQEKIRLRATTPRDPGGYSYDERRHVRMLRRYVEENSEALKPDGSEATFRRYLSAAIEWVVNEARCPE